MRDKDLYQTLLGLSDPWYVDRVELRLQQHEVHVWVEDGEHSWLCPECMVVCPLYDHSEERMWRHLDTMQYTTLVHARPPRVSCDEHGVRQVKLPWSEAKSRFTLLFEGFAITVLQAVGVAGAQKILKLSWHEAWQIERRAVERGLARKKRQVPRLLGIDEKAYRRGQDAYMTVVSDLERATVEWIGEDRRAETLMRYFEAFSTEELEQIRGIAMDMWKGYKLAIRTTVPDAERKMIYDRFHVMKDFNTAVDLVRKRESRSMAGHDDHRLKGTKYLWLRSRENVPRKHRRWFAALKRASLKTGRAWAIKEQLRRFWHLTTEGGAIRFWKSWFFWATHSRLMPIIRAAKKLQRHVAALVNYFRCPITNAQAEGLNGRIETIKRVARGYRNLEHFKIAIFFHCGGLDLQPATHGKP
jgi:transposase